MARTGPYFEVSTPVSIEIEYVVFLVRNSKSCTRSLAYSDSDGTLHSLNALTVKPPPTIATEEKCFAILTIEAVSMPIATIIRNAKEE